MRFTIPRDIYYGNGSLEYLKKVQGKKAVIVTGGASMERSGFLGKAKKYLDEAGVKWATLEGIEPDPSVGTVMKGAEFMSKEKPDLIVAIGGGSAIDAAKAMWIFYEHPKLTFEDVKAPFTLPELRKKAHFIAIPSTSGTATEVTSFTVITDEATGIKYPLADFNLTPDVAIVDAELAEGMPKELAVHTGLDALTHAVEAYVATQATDFTDPLALRAIQMIFGNLVKSCEGDQVAREKMHYAQCLAGMAFSNALLGIAHSLAHKTGHIFGIPHGLANAIYLPYIIEYNSGLRADGGKPSDAKAVRDARKKYAEIAKAIGVKEEDEAKLVQKLVEFVRALENGLNTPQCLRAYGIDEMEFRKRVNEIAENAENDPCTSSNPRKAEAADLKQILHYAFEGKEIDF